MLSFQKLNYMLFIDTIISLKTELLEFIKGFMFVFMLYVFQSCWYVSLVEPVINHRVKCLAQGHNTAPQRGSN